LSLAYTEYIKNVPGETERHTEEAHTRIRV
jgi:hypothetical protein